MATPRPFDRSAATTLPDVLRFMQILWRVVHGLERASKRMATTHGVTGPQRLVLRLVGLQPGISAGALAGILHVHPSTLTGVLRRLQGQGMLARGSAPGDRRRAVLKLTAKGRRINDVRRGTIEAAVETALRGISPADRAAARRALAAIADRVGSS
jgi:DNA-binding MarR family transcriptional regulator